MWKIHVPTKYEHAVAMILEGGRRHGPTSAWGLIACASGEKVSRYATTACILLLAELTPTSVDGGIYNRESHAFSSLIVSMTNLFHASKVVARCPKVLRYSFWKTNGGRQVSPVYFPSSARSMPGTQWVSLDSSDLWFLDCG